MQKTAQTQDLLAEISQAISQEHGAPKLAVKVFSPGSIGGSPHVTVTRVDRGFDWDAGLLMITTDKPLTTLSPDQVADITKSVRLGESWHAYQRFKALTAEVQSLRDRLMQTKDADSIDQAFKIADQSMIELLLAHCVVGDDAEKTMTLTDKNGYIVDKLDAAAPFIQDAFAWLSQRGKAYSQKKDHWDLIVLRT